jgi:hypothetical protein
MAAVRASNVLPVRILPQAASAAAEIDLVSRQYVLDFIDVERSDRRSIQHGPSARYPQIARPRIVKLNRRSQEHITSGQSGNAFNASRAMTRLSGCSDANNPFSSCYRRCLVRCDRRQMPGQLGALEFSASLGGVFSGLVSRRPDGECKPYLGVHGPGPPTGAETANGTQAPLTTGIRLE